MRRTVVVGVVLLSLAGVAVAQEGSLRFERTVAFQADKRIELGARVGPVRVATLELSAGGGGGVRDSILSRVRGGGDTSTALRASFDTENPTADEWVVTYTLEFLDRQGKLIDRASKSEGFEGEAAVLRLDHSILTYVVPLIDKVKVRLEARLD
jgi:hypothetical protein